MRPSEVEWGIRLASVRGEKGQELVQVTILD